MYKTSPSLNILSFWDCLGAIARRMHACLWMIMKDVHRNDKTMTMALLGGVNKDAKTACSSMDIRVYYIHLDSCFISKIVKT